MKTKSSEAWPFRRLPLKTLYRGLELSPESEKLLDEAMARLDTDDPNKALEIALQLFLKQQSEGENA